MPPAVAALFTFVLVGLLFVREGRRARGVNGLALWLPVLWIVVTGSRFVSQWIATFSGGFTFSSVEDGNPVDAAYFSALMLAGAAILARRPSVGAMLLRHNRLILLFLLYGLLSIAWSDFPWIALKRWVKACGHPIMALLILTDPEPMRAFRLVMKRCSFALLGFSVLAIKYYPEIGRGFDQFTGVGFNRGVGITKNDLGYICMVFGLFHVWNWFAAAGEPTRRARRNERVLSISFVAVALWLLNHAHSATSTLTFVLGAVLVMLLGTGVVPRRRVVAYLVAGLVVAVVAQVGFDLYDAILKGMGRAPTLTDRTVVWKDVIALQDRPLIGAGFESFWLGSRLEALWAKWWWRPNQAHNGYIETYLNLGWIGVGLLVAMLLSSLATSLRQVSAGRADFADFRLALLVAIIFFNYTEATFKGVHLLWTMFYLVALDPGPMPRRVPKGRVSAENDLSPPEHVRASVDARTGHALRPMVGRS